MTALTEFSFLTLDDLETRGKTVFVRVDMNCPLDPLSKEIIDDTRIRMTRDTLEALRSAKVIVGSHQGRPGDDDFTSLEGHARLLQKYVAQRVVFVEDVLGPEAQKRIKSLGPGELLVLDNLRLCSEENLSGTPEALAKTIMVQRLVKLLDVYVNDAFATAHRAQPSIVGIPQLVPAAAGRLMAKELEALRKAYFDPERPSVYVLGGAKVEDKLPVIENILRAGKADKILTGGMVANIFLRAQGIDFGESENRRLDKSAVLLEKAREILVKYKDKVQVPKDLGMLRDGRRLNVSVGDTIDGEAIRDVGPETARQYADIIRTSKTAVSSGPMGVFEEKDFEFGTKAVLEAMAGQGAFTAVGGGHMGSYASMLGTASKLSHVSTAGGAMLTFLAGRDLPGLSVLVNAARRHRGSNHRCVVPYTCRGCQDARVR